MRHKIKLVIFDLDDTLTVGPTIWELIHKEAGTWHTYGMKYYKDFLAGKFDYDEFMIKDVSCWKGLPLKKVESAIRRIKFIPKIRKTINSLKNEGIETAVISSSIEIFTEYVEKKFGIDHVYANPLVVKNGKLTGKVLIRVGGNDKGLLARKLLKLLKLKKSEVLALGDSIYDIPMFREVGTSITFSDANEVVKRYADYIINKNDIYKLIQIVKSAP